MILAVLLTVIVMIGMTPLGFLYVWGGGAWTEAVLLSVFLAYWALIGTIITRV
jgi:hypothetical protein